MQVKKYGNRRLYDTEASRYVTLEEVAERVRLGEDLRVQDAKTGQDLTQVTLAQIILESRGAARLLPVPLLKQLVRMRDDALGEFFGRYVAWALDVYLRLKQGARIWNPLAGFGPDLLGRLLRGGAEIDAPPAPLYPDEPEPDAPDDLARLRRELDELKQAVRAREPEGARARESELRRELDELRQAVQGRDEPAREAPRAGPARAREAPPADPPPRSPRTRAAKSSTPRRKSAG